MPTDEENAVNESDTLDLSDDFWPGCDVCTSDTFFRYSLTVTLLVHLPFFSHIMSFLVYVVYPLSFFLHAYHNSSVQLR